MEIHLTAMECHLPYVLLIYTAHSKDITQFFGVNSNVQHY